MLESFKKILYFFILFNSFIPSALADDFDFDFDEDFVIDDDPGIDDSVKNNISSEEVQFLAILAETQQEPIWNQTRPTRGRDPLYLMTSSLRDPTFRGLYLNIFYNFTNKMPTSLGDAFSLNFNTQQQEDSFFTTLAAIAKANNGVDADSDDIATLMPMFENLWVQERKFGILTKLSLYNKPFSLRFELPVLLSERNLMTSKSAQNRINQLIEENFGTFDTGLNKEREFARIRIGIGDLRTRFGVNFQNHKKFIVCGGVSTIIPTAVGLLLDGKFKHPIEEYEIDDSLVGMLNNARKTLLDPELGNNGHFGLGIYLESKLNLASDVISLWGRFSYEDLFTAKEHRLIMSKKTLESARIIAQGGATDEEFEEFRDQYVTPQSYGVAVNPGGVFNIALMADFKWGGFSVGVGYDYYFKQREVFERLYDDNVSMNSLRVTDAVVDRAFQHKLTAELNYETGRKNSKFYIGLGCEATMAHRNLGSAWTIYSKIGFDF